MSNPGVSASTPAVPGFDPIGLLAEGRHGSVWSGRWQDLPQPVALKIVARSKAGDVARFLRETRTLMDIRHPHVVRCHAAGEQGDLLWLVMDLAEGGDVGAILRRGRLPEANALAIIRDAAAGLGELGRRGLVHRDISPGNLLLMADGRCVLGDFGLVQDDREALTRTGDVLGTPAYMSPEQARGGAVDVRSDLYALGACLYAMVTGVAPYQGDSPWTVLRQVATGPFPDPRQRRPEVSIQVASMVRAATAVNPVERYQHEDMLREDAVAVLAGGTPLHAGTVHAACLRRAPEATTASPGPAVAPLARHAPWAAALVAGVVVGALAARTLGQPGVEERAAFAAARDANTPAAWRDYLDRHPDGAGAGTAQTLLRLLTLPEPVVDDSGREELRRQVEHATREVLRLRAAARSDR